MNVLIQSLAALTLGAVSTLAPNGLANATADNAVTTMSLRGRWSMPSSLPPIPLAVCKQTSS